MQLSLTGLVLGALVLCVGAGCTPQIGDSCQLSTDCGATGNLVCDTSQFMGYCTQLNCTGQDCPDNAACIRFHATVPGCGYDDRQGENARTGIQFCMKTCSTDSDCRPGYICDKPTGSPWFALNLDNNQNNHVCIPMPGATVTSSDSGSMSEDAPVCRATIPEWDAFPPVSDAADGP